MTEAHPDRQLDPVIVDAVTSIANRFGSTGLEDLIELAQAKLAEAKAALADLGQPD